MKTALRTLLLLSLATPAFAAQSPVDFKTATLPNVQNNRPLELTV
ncbi:hypothetical protein OKW09_003070 [Pseudomonas rhodesiae]|jgi:hypothetical protein|nr:hypothetical protein [Pseudomonas rhodesiae]MDF9770785.1 hypothetical protein [Pseudomonas rhodesiae]